MDRAEEEGAPATTPILFTRSGSQIWLQDDLDAAKPVEPGDSFGRALAAGEFNGDGIITTSNQFQARLPWI